MTIIAGIELDGEIALAADGRYRMNDVIVSDGFDKIVSHGDDFHVGVSGSPSHASVLRELIADHPDPDSLCAAFRSALADRESEIIADRDGSMPAHGVCLVLINPEGAWHADGELYPQLMEPGRPATAGSGMESGAAAALSILSVQSQLAHAGIPAGLNAETVVTHAVKIASLVDCSCGGKISVATTKKAMPDNVTPFPSKAAPLPPSGAAQ